jgi:hypothetical protein
MIQIEEIQAGDLFARLTHFTQETGLSFLDEILITQRNIAKSMAFSTQPFGLSPASKKKGQKAVAKDIRKLFVTPATLFDQLEMSDPRSAYGFWAAWKEKDLDTMRVVLGRSKNSDIQILSAPSAQLHGSHRKSRGRVYKKKPVALILNKELLADYIKERQKMVGVTKEGWAEAAKACGGTRGFPAWVNAGRKRSGSADVVRDPFQPQVTITNSTPWITEALPPGTEQEALRIGVEKLLKRIDIILRKTAQKNGIDSPF